MKAKGTVHKFGDNVDTDVIIPARYLNKSDEAWLASHCMEDIDADFVNKVKPGDIMVAEANFGCGSSREHAPIAIKASGISCVIASTFARIFYRNAINNGMLIIELPEYKAPSARTIWIYVWEKVKDYLTKAGTVIFLASIAMWLLLNFGIHGYTNEMSESFGAAIGHFIVPVLKPIGLGYWQIAVALIAGISAKEVVVSSCAVLFGIANVNSAAGMGALHQALGAAGFGMVNAYCLMIFCLLYIPCFATLATIRKESGSIKFMFLAAGFQLVMAWLASFVVFQIF